MVINGERNLIYMEDSNSRTASTAVRRKEKRRMISNQDCNCGKQFTNNYDLSQHQLECKKGSFSCVGCGRWDLNCYKEGKCKDCEVKTWSD